MPERAEPSRREVDRGSHRVAKLAITAIVALTAATACGSEAPAARGSTPGVPSDAAAGTSAAPSTTAAAPSPETAPEVTTTTAPAPETTTSTTSTTPAGSVGYAVATITRTFEDTVRGRTLATTIYYPAASPAPAARSVDAPALDARAGAAPASGPFPLILLAHGYRLPGDGYDRVMKAVAAHGYVVAAPEFPHTTGHGGDGLRRDITNQPADLSFVADQVIGLVAPGAGASAIPPIGHPDRIGVVGHSDGGLTATAFGYGHQYRDRRVAAVVSLTGGVGLFPGAFFSADSPPVLAAHTRDDSTNPYSASESLFRSVPAGRPRFLLSIEGGGHIDPYMFANGRVDLGDAIAAFLDLTLGNDAAAADRLRAVGTRPGFTLDEG